MRYTFRLCDPCNSVPIAYCTGEQSVRSASLNSLAKGYIVLARNIILYSFFHSFYLSLFLTFFPSSLLFVYLSFYILSVPPPLLLYFFLSFFLSLFFILSAPHSLLLYFFLPSCNLSFFFFSSFCPPHSLFLYFPCLLSFLLALFINFVMRLFLFSNIFKANGNFWLNYWIICLRILRTLKDFRVRKLMPSGMWPCMVCMQLPTFRRALPDIWRWRH